LGKRFWIAFDDQLFPYGEAECFPRQSDRGADRGGVQSHGVRREELISERAPAGADVLRCDVEQLRNSKGSFGGDETSVRYPLGNEAWTHL